YFKTSYVTLGSGLYYYVPTSDTDPTNPYYYNYVDPGEEDENNIAYTLINPTEKISSASGNDKDVNAIDFIIVPKAGMTFTPTSVSFNALRIGTGGGDISIFWVSDTGKETELEQGIIPGRNKADQDDPNYEFSYNVSASGSTGACGLRIYVYNLADNKQDGFANVVINGTMTGELEDVTQYNLSVNISPEGAATVKQVPDGTTFDEGDQVTLTQTRGFGYQFDGWTDENGTTLSTDDTYIVTMDADKMITANYSAIDTYELTINVDEANDYMVECDPEPTLIDGKKMYETGTVVTLTANSNNILTFTNWSTGSTESIIALTMDQDQTIGASYSAIDYLAGWDFYLSGNEDRIADFAGTGNDTDVLVLRDADGNTVSWMDKSEEADGGYNGKPAAVNWKTNGQGYYYWQTMVNASAYTDIKVSSAMQYNFLAYTKYDVQYSLNNSDWTTVGTISLTDQQKVWVTGAFPLPSDANNQAELYIRWYPDKSSTMEGTDSENDGIAIAEIFITGTEEIVDDGIAPVLVSSIPEDEATEVSANGKIVLTFDEKVQMAGDATATIGTQDLTATVTGKTITFAYTGLEYSTQYTFTLPANSVSDLSGNTLTEAIVISFTTKMKPEVEKKLYDFIVPDDGDFEAALAAANSRSNTSERYRIFVKKGTYTVPEKSATIQSEVDGNYYPISTDTISKPNVSIIGEDRDATIIRNTLTSVTGTNSNGTVNVMEGLGRCETLDIESKATGTYFQDITLKNSLPDNRGRGAALEDKSDKTICKNVCLYGYQDTYYSRSSNRYYFEGGKLRGRTDFLCGRGDIYFNGVELVMCESGGYLTAPSVPKEYGYIFRDCTINGESSSVNGNYYLGRPWGTGTPICLYINTTMNAEPSSVGWHDMSDDNYPARFAEYNSMTSSGSTISLSSRKTTFGPGNHANDPVLTAQEAALYTIETVMGSTDGWDPTEYTEQASAPQNVTISGTTLTWDNSNYVLCYAICKDGSVIDFTTDNSYTVTDTSATYSVRAANEMGGLGDAAVAEVTGIKELLTSDGDILRTSYYNLQGARVSNAYKGVVIKVDTKSDGKQVSSKLIK
ncbi:MAG: pectinesterase family protein, partial [Prevotella sp.]|nr:pectinesterase family protein [Prevotella sp.]